MNQYEIALPVFRNSRRGNYETERGKWENFALDTAEGFTRLPQSEGVWRDPKTKRVYTEPMVFYRIASTSETFDALLRKAFDLFPDQLAFYTATTGEAFLINREHKSETVA